jgi:hypothetical protein
VDGFDVVVGACAGVVVVAVDVDVSVPVSLSVDFVIVGVFDSPGTVRVGAVVGSGSEAFSLPPPHATRNGTRAVRAATESAPRKLMA